jgi:hypothetical protein
MAPHTALFLASNRSLRPSSTPCFLERSAPIVAFSVSQRIARELASVARLLEVHLREDIFALTDGRGDRAGPRLVLEIGQQLLPHFWSD